MAKKEIIICQKKFQWFFIRGDTCVGDCFLNMYPETLNKWRGEICN